MEPWIVLKFGGTSVSSLANWRNIVNVVERRRESGARVLIVHSALSGVTDRLEKLLDAALARDHDDALYAIADRHRCLASELGVSMAESVDRYLTELRQIAEGVALVGEVSDRTRARVMATGELMATELGASFMRSCGLPVIWMDARRMLRSETRASASAKASVLSATCRFSPDEALLSRLADVAPIVITQGFIASDEEGNTVLLGRGGSDTSSAYFAAKLRAQRLEIWTDVPGLFSANPRSIGSARLLRALHYDEAQEIATSGAKILHPRCIMPVRQYGIPLHVHATQVPDFEGTILSAESGDRSQVKAVCTKKGITLVSMESPGMWHQVGFLADVFQIFKQHGLSVDLVSTSETNVTVSLDAAANTLDQALIAEFVADLSRLCRVEVIGPCASVSLVGRNIRAILHQLGGAFTLFEEQQVYLVSQAANDLNFTFVVDEEQSDPLVEQLHELLIKPIPGDQVLGPTWEQLFSGERRTAPRTPAWWHERRDQLLTALGEGEAAYVYDLGSIQNAARALRGLKSIARVHYSMKANPHPKILETVRGAGLDFECVSQAELERLLKTIPNIERGRIIYTPNFAPRDEYAWALAQGVRLTVDNAYALATWGPLFRNHEIFVRVDPGSGHGHHRHVRTGGTHSKFGVGVSELAEVARLARQAGARIVGLHAHAGSGILEVASWERSARLLAQCAKSFESVRVIDIGGGLGIPERAEQPVIDLGKLDALLSLVRLEYPQLEIWLEPGRYVVAAAGVLLARVTQLKNKDGVRFIGISTGMNSLVRPALYGAYHQIVNLTRADETASELANVVGPICESADVLGYDRLLPVTHEGDVLLIANVGAYGHAMSSTYNLRAPAVERFI